MPIPEMHPFYNFPGPPTWYTFWEDWDDEYTGQTTSAAAGNRWIQTLLSSGTFAQTTDEQFGVAVLSGNATSDNSGAQVQADMEIAALVAGKKTRWMCRAKLSDATHTHFFNGLSITDTTVCDGADGIAGLTPSDCVGFYKADDAATVAIVVKRDSAVVCNTTVATLEDATYYWFMFEVDMDATVAGKGTVRAWVYNSAGTLIGQSAPILSLTMPYSSEEILTPTVSVVSGNATGTKTLTVDCAGFAMQR